ncbi:hypothetical protein L3081_14535 [Colwellia sp. MSW7]|uniref:Uncharacterized protein n=1 Tax=Colwellia maritima TaxID=2912588 RepID=A0ABS9X2G0_9GAMM|nr:hypothetical protein [Colwellia maritima]MCI2284380.1 hypothetical protein [Colwellia maritima]
MKILKSSMLILSLFSYAVIAEESTCHGTTSKGRLENGVELPSSGKNFLGYSDIARLVGQNLCSF